MSRMELAIFLETTEANVANIENCKDESKKFGRKREAKIIKEAALPPGFFIHGDII